MDKVLIGKVLAHHGVAGWLKIYSFSRPLESIADYQTWWIEQQPYQLEQCRRNNKAILAKLQGLHSREQTQSLIGQSIYIDSTELPDLPQDEYYWRELIGLNVINEQGIELGRVEKIHETGANDVLQIKTPNGSDEEPVLIPWGKQYILKVDQDNQSILVHWQLEY